VKAAAGGKSFEINGIDGFADFQSVCSEAI
jgi:hypothetical protein